MNTIPHEDELAARWSLDGRIPLSRVAEGASWRRARVRSSGESVVLFIVHGPTALETADAARRVYLVEDPHLLPVREVVVFDDPREDGEDAEHPSEPTTVVEYPMPSAPPLAALLAKGTLRPETARSVIGEAARGLEAARRRGVRQQFLDSNRLFVNTSTGEVTVLGVGVEAAAHEGLDRSGEVASFQDTAALTALLYRMIAGRSPRRGEDGTVPRMSALASRSVPTELDELADLVLNESADVIPETTRELISELEPWQSIPVTLEAYDPEDPAPVTPAGGRPAAQAVAEPSAPTTAQPDAQAAAEPRARPDAHSADGEATALMEAVEDDPAAHEDAVATSAAAAALGAAAAGTAAATASMSSMSAEAAEDAGGTTHEQPRVDSEQPRQEGTPPTGGTPDASEQSPETEQPDQDDQSAQTQATAEADQAEQERQAAAAQGLVSDLHLTDRRDSSPFPGHLDIAPSTPSAGTTVPGAGAPPNAGAPAEEPTTRTGTTAEPETAAPADGSSPDPQDEAPESSDADSSDATVQGLTTGPVLVPGRSVPLSASGPIVVPGRDRSHAEGARTPLAAPADYSRSGLLRDVVSVATDRDETGATFAMGPEEPEARNRLSQWILLAAILFVIVAMVLAVTTITSGLRQKMENPLGTASPTATAPSAEDSQPSEEPEKPSEEPTKETLPAPEVSNVEVFANGGNPDNTDQAPRMTDGDPNTFWSTKHYARDDFAGTKAGVGVRVSFAKKATLTRVVLTTARNTGGAVELRAVDEAGNPGEVIATGAFAGDGEVTLAPEKPVEANGFTLWVAQLPPDSKEAGRFRGRIAEIRAE